VCQFIMVIDVQNSADCAKTKMADKTYCFCLTLILWFC
jgi:hypothetical protein